jgi:hypothetical protein
MPVEVLKFDVVVHSTVMWVREWRLKNRSGKATARIRPALFVYRESEPDTLLLRRAVRRSFGLTLVPSEEWPKAACLPSALSCHSAFAMLSAGELLKAFAESGEPVGKYRVALGIDKVWFEDGTIWEFEATKDIDVKRLTHSTSN